MHDLETAENENYFREKNILLLFRQYTADRGRE